MDKMAKKYGIEMTARQVDGNPNMPDFQGDHWRVTLTRRDWSECKGGKVKRTSLIYSMGYGHKGKPPSADSVLESLCSDAQYRDMDFSEFCFDLGVSEDSRAEYRTWKATLAQSRRFEQFMSPDFSEIMLEEW